MLAIRLQQEHLQTLLGDEDIEGTCDKGDLLQMSWISAK